MTNAELVRFASCIEQGTFGKLYFNGELICYTVEQPYRNNLKFISCVPDGLYKLKPYNSERYGYTWQLLSPLLNVYTTRESRAKDSDRYACQFHYGNFMRNVKGCIAPGDSLSASKGNWMVTNSVATMEKIRNIFVNNYVDHLIISSECSKIIKR